MSVLIYGNCHLSGTHYIFKITYFRTTFESRVYEITPSVGTYYNRTQTELELVGLLFSHMLWQDRDLKSAD